MSIDFKVTQNGLRIEAFPKGVLGIKDTLEYFCRLTKDKDIKRGATEIVYFNDVTDFKLSFVESEEITRSYQEPKEHHLIEETIFVCETKLAYGIGRMLQTFHEITNPDHNVGVVNSKSELRNIPNQA